MTKLSETANLVWQLASMEAKTAKYKYIEKEHLFMAITSLSKILSYFKDKSISAGAYKSVEKEKEEVEKLFQAFSLDSSKMRRNLRKKMGVENCQHNENAISRSEESKFVFNVAQKMAEKKPVIDSLCLLAGIFEKPGEYISTLFKEEKADISAFHKMLNTLLVSDNKKDLKENNKVEKDSKERKTTFLDAYGIDLTAKAKAGKLGPFVGRRNELLQILQTLARNTKNNPVLIGEAGVGKTAVIEALALRCVEGKDQQVLKDKRIIELNMGTLTAGTKYRGEFEERITNIIKETQKSGDVILFIDELHLLVGTGKVDGSMDAANIMKPALARGGFKCIGATTFTEYRRYIEADSALERRFEKVIINEPSRDEALEIIKGLRPKWEKHHGVLISDESLEAAIDLTIRFDTDHRLPDKAIDVIDKAGARCLISDLSIAAIPDNKESGSLKTKVIPDIIAEVLAEKLGLPVGLIKKGQSKSTIISGLEPFLKERLIGQDNAIETVCRKLMLAHSGLAKKKGPLAVFLFMGPTGVGKTELSRLITQHLFGNSDALTRFDMSEYMEEHSIARLIGSPPGYVGYEEEGQLTAKIRNKPYSVILFDEIEKSHPRVFDLCLQLFDDGRLTDSHGRTVDARNIIFILTTNIMAEDRPRLGFKAAEGKNEEFRTALINALKKHFRMEFINRIDELIFFNFLNKSSIEKILQNILIDVAKNLKENQNITLIWDEKTIEFLLQQGYNPQFGARELQRAVENHFKVPLSNLLYENSMQNAKEIWVTAEDNKLRFSF